MNPTGLVEADILKRIGFNVDIQTSDFATIAARRASRAPVSEGGWSAIPVIWNAIDLLNPLTDPAVFNNCNQYNPGWYCDEELSKLLQQYAEWHRTRGSGATSPGGFRMRFTATSTSCSAVSSRRRWAGAQT